jgi:hypothetical protein
VQAATISPRLCGSSGTARARPPRTAAETVDHAVTNHAVTPSRGDRRVAALPVSNLGPTSDRSTTYSSRLSPTLTVSLGTAAKGPPERSGFLVAHLGQEVHEGEVGVVTVVERLAHELGAVLLPGRHRAVDERPASRLPGQPALAVQVVHHGLHRGVGDLALLLELVHEFADAGRLIARPESVHQHRLEVTEPSHGHGL